MNKKVILTAAAISVLGAGILSASTAFAQQNKTISADPMSSLVQKIADKFNLNKDEVQAVFDEAHEERHAEMQAEFEKQLSQYVTEGKITEAQKGLILQKHKEMGEERMSEKDSFHNLSEAEIKAHMDKKRTELEAWAKENGIDLQYLMPKGKRVIMFKHDGFGPASQRGEQGKESQQPITTVITQ